MGSSDIPPRRRARALGAGLMLAAAAGLAWFGWLEPGWRTVPVRHPLADGGARVPAGPQVAAVPAAPVPVPVSRPGPGAVSHPVPAPGPALGPVVELKAEGPVAPAVPGAGGPTFDVVRVSPRGSAVIAGRADAGSEVVVFDGEREVARVRADRRGEFVALPPAPLAPGGRELTLAARGPDGGEVRGTQSVVVVVPDAPRAREPLPPPPVVALLDAQGGARMLQEPQAVRAPLSLDIVDYDAAGAVRFSGRSSLGSAVRVYVDNGVVGDAQADAAGRWTLMPEGVIAPGVHTLRADAIDRGGRVVARVELPFQRASAVALEPGPGRVVVQPGQSLWRLARMAYGRGIRYTVIFEANQDQIRDPRRIYPGQAFSVPGAAP